MTDTRSACSGVVLGAAGGDPGWTRHHENWKGRTMNTHADDIATQVRCARRARGWTGAQLADAAGVAGGTIVRIENGRDVRPGNLRAVLDALDLTARAEEPVTGADEDARFAVELVQKWIEALDPDERAGAIRDLTRFVVTRQTGR